MRRGQRAVPPCQRGGGQVGARVPAEERPGEFLQCGEGEFVTRATVRAGTERKPRARTGVTHRRRQRRQHQGSFGDAPRAYPRLFAGDQRRGDREQGAPHHRLPDRLRPCAFPQEDLRDRAGVLQ